MISSEAFLHIEYDGISSSSPHSTQNEETALHTLRLTAEREGGVGARDWRAAQHGRAAGWGSRAGQQGCPRVRDSFEVRGMGGKSRPGHHLGLL